MMDERTYRKELHGGKARRQRIIENKMLLANLKATENFLSEQGQGSYAYYIRQALDIIFPEWRE